MRKFEIRKLYFEQHWEGRPATIHLSVGKQAFVKAEALAVSVRPSTSSDLYLVAGNAVFADASPNCRNRAFIFLFDSCFSLIYQTLRKLVTHAVFLFIGCMVPRQANYRTEIETAE